MDFKEFLKKKSKYADLKIITPVYNSDFKSHSFISTEDLGIWAWNEIGELNNCNIETDYISEKTMLYEIALACLGKEEIEKRMKELTESEKQ